MELVGAVEKRCGYVNVDFDRTMRRYSTGISSRFVGSAASLKIQGASQIVLDLVNHDQAAMIVCLFSSLGRIVDAFANIVAVVVD